MASVAQANATCLTNSNKTSCDYSYGPNAIINRINLYGNTVQGQGLWVSYSYFAEIAAAAPQTTASAPATTASASATTASK